jgi:hypothetical protein
VQEQRQRSEVCSLDKMMEDARKSQDSLPTIHRRSPFLEVNTKSPRLKPTLHKPIHPSRHRSMDDRFLHQLLSQPRKQPIVRSAKEDVWRSQPYKLKLSPVIVSRNFSNRYINHAPRDIRRSLPESLPTRDRTPPKSRQGLVRTAHFSTLSYDRQSEPLGVTFGKVALM